MKANRMWLFSDVLEKNKRVFKVPVYQRNYDWSNIECEKLYQDIINAFDKDCQHFTGTLVYIDDVNGGSGLNEVLIIDGQQRITTIYILLKALYDASKGVLISVENEIADVIFNRHCDEKYKVKLKPVKTDNEQLTYLVKDKIDEMDRNSNVYKNYIIFKNLIEQSLANGYDLADILRGIKKLEIVEIILDKLQGDQPQKIFESINSTGLELSLADLIRNYLLMDDVKQEELYEEYWLVIERNVGYRNLGDFVINYLNSQITKSVNSKNAYRLFKEHCESNGLSHEDVLTGLRRTSKYYGAFIGENECYSTEIMKYMNAFNTIKQTTVLPFLFKIFDDYEENNIKEDTLCKILSYLLTYFVRTNACEINKNMAKFMKSLYGRVFDSDYDNYLERFVVFLNDIRTNDRMPTDKEFKDALMYKPLYTKNICKYLLSVIENSTKEHIDVSTLTRQINNSGIYFETNLSANGIVSFIKDLLMQMKLEVDDFSFSLSEVPFSVNNEATWGDGVIPVAKLFYNFIEELTKQSLIKDSEIKKLKTKSYTKELFNATDYPALADNRTDNMGNSIQKRYRVKPIRFNGMDIFVSTQFFDSDRDAVIAWYKSHLS